MKSVLVIDFIKENLELVENMLKSKFRVTTAESVDEAINIMSDDPPDIVLITHVFPDSTAVEVLKKLTKNEKRFIAMMMTGVKDMEIVGDAILHGFDGFIKIPVELGKFTEQLKKAKAIHEMRDNASKYLKVLATKAMSITFSHYTRNLLTPLIGYLSSIKGKIDDRLFSTYSLNLNKINKLTYKLEELLESDNLNENSYADGTMFYEIDLDDKK